MGKPLILCVDDEIGILDEVAEELIFSGFDVVCQTNGVDAFDYLQSLRDHDLAPSVIVCDVRMPLLDGFSLRRKMLSEMPDRCAIPFVLLTALEHDLNQELCGDLKVAASLPKPFELDALVETVRRLIP